MPIPNPESMPTEQTEEISHESSAAEPQPIMWSEGCDNNEQQVTMRSAPTGRDSSAQGASALSNESSYDREKP
jgi:hypothetical protein